MESYIAYADGVKAIEMRSIKLLKKFAFAFPPSPFYPAFVFTKKINFDRYTQKPNINFLIYQLSECFTIKMRRILSAYRSSLWMGENNH